MKRARVVATALVSAGATAIACSAFDPNSHRASRSAPEYDASSTTTTPLDLSAGRAYCLSALNAIRADAGLPAYAGDGRLDVFSQAASEQLSRDHAPHAYFEAHKEMDGGFVRAENQGNPEGWPPAAETAVQIDLILEAMMAEAPDGGHRVAIVSPQWKKVGVGLVQIDGKLFFTNDFSE